MIAGYKIRPGSYIISIFLLLFVVLANVKVVGQTNKPAQNAISKSVNTFRISTALSLPEQRFTELLDFFDKYKGATDEITFFTSITHPPPTLADLRQRVQTFKGRMELARKRGYKAGINVLNTVGHHDENMENALKGDYTRMTDIDGNVCNGAFCSNDGRFSEEYIKEIYKATALARPDYIWIDDDVRIAGHGPVRYACFCDNCIRIFNETNNTSHSRASLKKAFNEGPIEEKLKVRRQWMEHNSNTISTMFELIEKTVHEIDPKIEIGVMTGDRFYEGYDFAKWSNILAGKNNVPVLWRPGGGAYTDLTPMSFIDKAHAIGRQLSVLPPGITKLQSEIENFPYQRFRKSASMVAFEAALYIAAGCTGAAYNVLTFYDEPLDEYRPLADSLQNVRPFLDKLANKLGRYPITGALSYWNTNSFVAANPESGVWLEGRAPLTGYDLYDNGIPASYREQDAPVMFMGKDMVYTMSREEIKKALSGALYIDAEALDQINKMGFGQYTGFETAGVENADAIERLTSHPINGKYAQRLRDNRQSFWRQPAYHFRKTNQKAEIVSELVNYGERVTGECAMGIFENSLGGRICVAGYYPWHHMGNLSKNTQIKAVFRWLSNDKLPGYVQSFHKANLWMRNTGSDKVALALSNSSFDAAKNVELLVKTKRKRLKLTNMQMKETWLTSSGDDNGYQKFIIPHLEPWKIGLITSE